MMEAIFNYDTQKKISRDDSGKIKSIKPIYDHNKDVFIRFHKQALKLKDFASEFPECKFQVEIHSIPEADFKMIKEDINMNPTFTDHGKRFFYCPTNNSVIIAHQEL